jgi:hypothetical protein
MNFVIISIKIENKEDKWVAVESTYNGLIDDKGNSYSAELYVEINDYVYTIQQIAIIGEDEWFGLGIYISSNSTITKKIVFSIQISREPEKLKLKYGLASGEYNKVIEWHTAELLIPS